jgi:hypothetical protein
MSHTTHTAHPKGGILLPDFTVAGHTWQELRFYAMGTYSNGRLALALANSDGFLITVTVNMVAATPGPDCVFVKTWSENEGILKQLTTAGILASTGRTVPAGFTAAHEARLLVDPATLALAAGVDL